MLEIIICCGQCSHSLLGGQDTNRLKELIKKNGSIIGCKPYTFEVVLERRTLNKLLSITNNPEHPLQHVLDRLSQGPIEESSPAQSRKSLQLYTSV